MQNANREDDIDLFIIVTKNTIWVTRLLTLFMLELFGVRRKRLSKQVGNTVCVNMFLDEQHVSLPAERHDIYTAQEIAQMKPLFERRNMYRQFLYANSWIHTFMPNVSISRIRKKYKPHCQSFMLLDMFTRFILPGIEKMAKVIQTWKINRTKTTEKISDVLLAFHPFDYRTKILSCYKRSLHAYIR